MEIVCEHCGARLNIPDEKIPEGRRVSASCPKCQKKLVLERPAPDREESAPIAEEIPEPAESKIAEADESAGEEDELDFYEEGAKPALVMVNDDHQDDILRDAMEELGYRHVSANNTRDAIGKMRYHHFDLIILPDRFDGIDLAQSPVLQYLNNLSMSVRRRIFVALIGDSFKTMDHMVAYAMSANLVINAKDLERVASILRHAISENDKFYKVFIEILAEVGKS